MKMRFKFCLGLILLMANFANAKVTISLFNDRTHGTASISGTHDTGSAIELDLKSTHLGCDKITIEKSMIASARVDHLLIEQKAVIESVAASSINDLSQFITKNEASDQNVMIDLTMAGCSANKMRVRVL